MGVLVNWQGIIGEDIILRRLSWLDILKGIGIILVVIGHIYLNPTVRDWLYSFHMPLFFLAAGLLYKEKPIVTDIKRRIKTIVIPLIRFFGTYLLSINREEIQRFRYEFRGFSVWSILR